MSDEATVVELAGEYDTLRRDELDQLLDRYGDAEPLILDLARVERFDTVALGSLIRFQKARNDAGKTPFLLVAPNPRVREFIELADVDRTFEIRDNV